jgi:hypothetical protein
MEILSFPFALFFAQLPPGGYPIAVKYIIPYRKIFGIIESYYTDAAEMVWSNDYMGLLQCS